MSNLVVLNIDSRYIQLIGASISADTGSIEAIKLYAKKEYSGFTNKDFINPDSFEKELKEILESTNVKKLDKIYVGVPSEFLTTSLYKTGKNYQKPTIITQKIIDELTDNLITQIQSPDYTIINSVPTQYTVDSNIINEIEKETVNNSLSIQYSVIKLNNSFVHKVNNVLLSLSIVSNASDIQYISQDLASFKTLVKDEEKATVGIIVKIDDLSTSIAICKDSAILSLSTAALGTSYIESEIYSKLEFPNFSDAEKILRQVLILQNPSKQTYRLVYQNETIDVPCDTAIQIIKNKLDEIASFIIRSLNSSRVTIAPSIPVRLVASSAYNIVGIEEYLNIKVNRNVSCCVPSLNKSQPELTSAISVLNYISRSEVKTDKNSKQSFLGKMFSKFKKK